MRSHQTSRFPVSHLRMQDTVSDGSHRLVLSGELDLVGAEELRSVILGLCGGRMNMLTLDFRKLTFLDSSGVKVVLLAKDLCHERGCDFSVVPGPAHVQRPFELCGPFQGLRFIPTSGDDSASSAAPSDFDRQLFSGSNL